MLGVSATSITTRDRGLPFPLAAVAFCRYAIVPMAYGAGRRFFLLSLHLALVSEKLQGRDQHAYSINHTLAVATFHWRVHVLHRYAYQAAARATATIGECIRIGTCALHRRSALISYPFLLSRFFQ